MVPTTANAHRAQPPRKRSCTPIELMLCPEVARRVPIPSSGWHRDGQLSRATVSAQEEAHARSLPR